VAAPEKIHRYRCPGCAADLEFAPRDGHLVCPYCGRSETIAPPDSAVEERSYEEYLRLHADRLGTMAEGALEVGCASCGAVVTFAPPQVAGECDFCGARIVAQPRSADPLLAPEGVLPFRIAGEEAAHAVARWIASRWFAPNALKRLASQEELGGVYLPFWTYDAFAASDYEGQRGDYYYEEEVYTAHEADGKAVARTRQVRQTRWRAASGSVSRWFDDITVPATRSLPAARLSALEPWDMAALVAYEPAYLKGFKAQRYQIDLAEGFELAKRAAAAQIESDVRRRIGGDLQRITSLSTRYSAITFKHVLLPVYVGAYRFRGRVYQVVVNGRTAEVQGDRPYSFWKIFFLVLFLLAATLVGVLLSGE
jgi:DNA-directed RNA polymerase subunit RPC12/RpoP